jgi:hypothetical protein
MAALDSFDMVGFRKALRLDIARLQKVLDACMVKPADIKFRAILPCPGRRD